MSFALFLDLCIVAWVLWRQTRVRRVRVRTYLRVAVFFIIIGVFQLVGYTNKHHLKAEDVLVLLFGLAVGAGGFGVLRGLSVRLWRTGNLLLQQGSTVTMVLWVLSFGLHFVTAWWISSMHGPASLEENGLLLYLGVTYAAQNTVIHRRALFLLAREGGIDPASVTLPQGWRGFIWTNGAMRPGPGDHPYPGGFISGEVIDADSVSVDPERRPPREGPPEALPPS
jgi:hypothetical protein